MKVPRFSIALLMVIVALAALDLETIRAMPVIRPPTSELLVLGALPMANVLAVDLLLSQRRPASRPFLLGFAAFGVVALALYVALVAFSPETVATLYVRPLIEPISRTIGPIQPIILIAILGSVGVVMLGLPQLALALLGGFMFRRFRIAERRNQTRCR